MPKILNGKMLTRNESKQFLSRLRESGVTQAVIGKLLKRQLSGAMVGRLLRGESTANAAVFTQIENIVTQFEKVKKYEKNIIRGY